MSTLVRLSDWLSDEGVNNIVMFFDSTFSSTKWYLIRTCLPSRRPLTSSLQDIDLRLSFSYWVGSVSMHFSSFNTIRNHFTSRIQRERALYSSSAVDCAVQDLRFDVQIIGRPLIVTGIPVPELRLDKSLSQSASVQHSTSTSFGLFVGSNIP